MFGTYISIFGALFLICSVFADEEDRQKIEEHLCGEEVTEGGQQILGCFDQMKWDEIQEFHDAVSDCCKGNRFSNGEEAKQALCELTEDEMIECRMCSLEKLLELEDQNAKDQVNELKDCIYEKD